MVAYYLDTSAILKEYVNESGSAWVQKTMALSLAVITTTQLTLAEVTSALSRRVREGTVTAPDYARLIGRFRDDCRSGYQLVAVNMPILRYASELLERHPLRAYDAIHLATALTAHRSLLNAHLPGFIFLCADDRLLNAAAAEGLAIDNPNSHL